MRRAIIHIGMPRTASTTIQHVLTQKRQLLAAAGILYPDLTPRSMAHEPHINHQHFGEALDGRRPRAEARELLAALSDTLAATDADTLLLSYEDWIQEKQAGRIAAVLRDAVARHGFRMEAIVVAKPQSEHINSLYSHRAQMMREKLLFADFCRGCVSARRFAYAELVDPWLAACEGRVCAVPLRDARAPEPLLHRFLLALDLADRAAALLAADDTARVENRSPGPVGVEVSRRLRLLRVPDRLLIRPRAAMRDIERAVAGRGLDAVPFKGVDPALRARLAERYAATNARFARTLWGADWDSVVRAEPEHPVNEIGGRPIPPDTERLVGQVVDETLSRLQVSPRRPWYGPVAELAEDASAFLQRRFRISKWRVV